MWGKTLLYNIGVFYSLYTPCDKSSPSIERGYWRPSRDPDSYGPRCIVHQAKAIRDVPTAGLRCGRCGFRGTAMSGSIPFRGFRDRLLSLPSFHTCQKKGRDPISSLRLDTLLFGLFSGLAPHPVDPLSAGRRTDLRRRVRVSEHLSAGLGCASTPEVFCLPHGVTPSYLVWRNGGVTRAVTPLRAVPLQHTMHD